MGQWFIDTEEHQANAHTGGKQHGKPCRASIRRFGVLPAKANLAQPGKRDSKAKQQNDITRNHEKPVEGCRNPVAHIAKQDRSLLLKQQSADNQRDYKSRGYGENRVMNVEPDDLNVLLTDFVFR